MLTESQIEQAAQLLLAARLSHTLIDCIPEHVRPHSLQEAYGIQDKLIELLGTETFGWFGACTNKVIQDTLGLHEPYYAYLLREHVYSSPAQIDTNIYPPIVFECEFGFVVNRDFTPQGRLYSREEIEQAIVKIHPVIEIVAGHLRDWPNQDVFSVIADNGTDGALVIGEGVTDWQSLDLVNTEVTLHINDNLERTGTGANVLGDPLGAFLWLVNAITRDNKIIKAGHVQNTGTATDIYWAKPGDTAVATYAGIGKVEIQLL